MRIRVAIPEHTLANFNVDGLVGMIDIGQIMIDAPDSHHRPEEENTGKQYWSREIPHRFYLDTVFPRDQKMGLGRGSRSSKFGPRERALGTPPGCAPRKPPSPFGAHARALQQSQLDLPA